MKINDRISARRPYCSPQAEQAAAEAWTMFLMSGNDPERLGEETPLDGDPFNY